VLESVKKTDIIHKFRTHDSDTGSPEVQIALLSEGKLIACLEPEEFLKSDLPEIQNYVRAFHRGERSAGRMASR